MCYLYYFLCFFLIFPTLIKSEVINQPVVNIYNKPQKDTELNSQSIYGDSVEILASSDDGWTKIKTLDGTEGWIQSSQITHNPSFEKHANLRPIKNLFAHVYRVTDTTPFPPILTLPYSSSVKLEEPVDKGERWVRIELISGEKAWIQQGDIDFFPRLKTLQETISFSKKFIGLPYTWGGASSYGFDCSGFIQMLFKEMGISLPHNASQQSQWDCFIPVEIENLQPGDLVFFGETKITHVGFYLGNGDFIHSGVRETPIIMISNLSSKKYNFQTARRIRPGKLVVLN